MINNFRRAIPDLKEIKILCKSIEIPFSVAWQDDKKKSSLLQSVKERESERATEGKMARDF